MKRTQIHSVLNEVFIAIAIVVSLNALRASIGTLSIVPEVLKKKKRSEWMGKWGTVWTKSGIVIISPPPPTFSAEES